MFAALDNAWLYIDFNSFFASAEQQLRPELRGRPVGVVPLISNRTVLIAASREAKVFGIKTGTPVGDAKRLCPDIALIPARHDVYVRLHHAIVAAVDSVVPVEKTCSIDEVACRLMKNERARATDLAHDIKRTLAREIGRVLTCSIGLAPNELLAKTAAEMQKPDGLVALRHEDLPGRLLDLALTDIPGIAKGNETRLAHAGITTVAQLWQTPPAQMRAIWGGVGGERFWAFLHGYEIEREETQRGMFGHSRVLGWDWRGPEKTEACARLLLVKAMRRMRREHLAATALNLSLKSENSTRWDADARHPAFRDDHTALAHLTRLFAAARRAGALGRTKKVHVTLHGLVPRNAIQADLLEDANAVHDRLRWERLADLTDHLHDRFKSPVLTLGARVEPPGGYAGGKIAFGRIPDLADF